MHGLSTNRVGEGHVARDDPNGRPGMSAGAVPIPALSGVDESLDYAQWVIEEIKPKVP